MRQYIIFVLASVFFVPENTFSQVHLQSGSAQVNIPLYSFSDNISRLRFDLALNYNSGKGLVVDEIPGATGANWQLNGIPKIVRLTKGIPDDQMYATDKPRGVVHQNKLVAQRGCPTVMNYYPISDVEGKTYDDPLITVDDKSADEFNVLLNGRVVQFYLRTKDALQKYDGSGIRILNSKDGARIVAYTDNPPNDNIDVRTSITRFEITDNDGLLYVFAEREYSQLFNYKTPSYIGPDMMRLICREVKDDLNTSHIVSAWALSKIVDPKTQREIIFNYLTQVYEFENFDDLYAGSNDHLIPTPPPQPPIVGNGIYSVYVTLRKNKLLIKHIESIIFPGDKVLEFAYNSSARKDLKGGYALNELHFKTNNELNFKYKFITSYFVKNNIEIPINEQQAKWSRLCLTGIQKLGRTADIVEPSYEFSYRLGTNASEDFVPPIFFHAKDPWGYYNGASCNVSLTDFVDKTTTSLSDWRKLAIYANRHYINQEEEFFSNTKLNFAANGLLTSVKTPGGKIIEYTYEQNKAKFSQLTRHVGGVHVSKVTEKNYGNNNEKIFSYSYTLPDGSSSLWGVELPRCVSKVTRHYAAEKNPGLTQYKYKYPLTYKGIDYSESVSKHNYIGTIRTVLQVYNTVVGIIHNPTPFNIVFQVGILLFNIGSGFIDNNEQTINQYYFHRDPLNFSNPLPAQFSRVVVKESAIDNGVLLDNGETQYEFTSDLDVPLILPTLLPGDAGFDPFFFSQSQRCYSWMYGLPKKIKTFAEGDNMPLKEIEYTYDNIIASDSHSDNSTTTCNCQAVYFDSKRESDYNPLTNDVDYNFTTLTVPNKLYVDFLYLYTGFAALKESRQTNYGINGITETVYYTYNDYGLVSSKKTIDSKGHELDTKTYYHNDFYQSDTRPNNIFTQLYDDNQGNTPIAMEVWQSDIPGQPTKLLSSELYEYGPATDGNIRLLNVYEFQSEVPLDKDIIKEFSYINPPPIVRNSSYFKLKNQIAYNLKGAPVQFTRSDHNTKNGIVYGGDQQTPIAKFTNAGSDEVAYTSFETEEKNNWEYDESRIVSVSAITGSKGFQLSMDNYKAIRLSQNLASPVPRPYILSFLANSPTVLVGGAQVSPVKNEDIIGWYFFKINFNAGEPVPLINGDCIIDELRWYPQDARMETYAYDNFGNLSALCDVNNNTLYREYDGLNRLTLVRDQERNILQKYCYNFYGQQEDCTGFYKSRQMTVAYTRNNCPSGYFPGSAISYVVQGGKYTSGISQEDADFKAEADIASNGQTHANTYGQCLPNAPFTKLTIENQYGNIADIVLRFYADQACTIPYIINDLTVIVQVEKYNDVTGISTYDSYNIECNGDMVIAFSSVLLIKQLNDSYYSSEYSFFSLIPDPTYTIVYY